MHLAVGADATLQMMEQSMLIFGDAGYIEGGSNGQVMVEQPRFYYRVMPLKLVPNNANEIARVIITGWLPQTVILPLPSTGLLMPLRLQTEIQPHKSQEKIRGHHLQVGVLQVQAPMPILRLTLWGQKATRHSAAVQRALLRPSRTHKKATSVKDIKNYKYRLYVSDNQHEGMKLHPAFVKNDVEVEKIYLSAYEGCAYDVDASAFILDDAQTVDFTSESGDILSSIASAKPISGAAQTLTRRNCGILAENRGTGWSQQYAATAACSQLLFTVEYASMNSQTAIGKGVDKPYIEDTVNYSEITGSTTNLGNTSGMAAGTNGLVSVTYRGEEKLLGQHLEVH